MSSIESDKKNQHVTTVISVEQEGKLNEKYVDKAYAFKDEIEGVEIDASLEKKMIRKIDMVLLPMIGLLMSLQLMDKTTNGYAAIMGLKEGLGIPTTGVTAAEADHNSYLYSQIGSSFYWGYLISAMFASRILALFPIATSISVIVMVWGIILGCHAACSLAQAFIGCRVLLGMCEAFMNSGYTVITSMWWSRSYDTTNPSNKKKRVPEQYLRTNIWFGAQGFGTILNASILNLLFKHPPHTIVSSWRLLYLITAAITIFVGIISFFFFPNIPAKAWFLNETEKKYTVIRSKQNQQGFGNTKFKKYQVIEAITDVRSYCLFFYAMSYGIANGSFNNFGSILLHEDFGFSTADALLMNMPGGAIDMLIPLLAYGLTYITRSTLISAIVTNTFCTVGMCCLAFAPAKGGRLFGYLTFYVATLSYATALCEIASNINGSTKKTVVLGYLLAAYSVGNLVGPFTFKQSEAPGYHSAKISLLVSFAVGTACFIIIYLHNTWENKKRDKLKQDAGDNYEVMDNFEFADLTDKENPEFRYST